MAYSDYGAYVYMNGDRREDKEDAVLFYDDKIGKETWITRIHHGIMGDFNIRVLCHKQQLPQVYELTEDGIKEINIPDGDDIEPVDWGTVEFEYKGYKFKFVSGYPNIATMIEPDGTEWRCEHDYWYGAGF